MTLGEGLAAVATRKLKGPVGEVTAGLIGAGVGWGYAALQHPQLTPTLAVVGNHVGTYMYGKIVSSRRWADTARSRLARRVLARKARQDLNNFCFFTAATGIASATESYKSLTMSGVVRGSDMLTLPRSSFHLVDYTGLQPTYWHASQLGKLTQYVRISCPPYFAAAEYVLRNLRAALEPFGIIVEVDDSSLTSKEQMNVLGESTIDHDLALVAESAYYMAPTSLGTRQRLLRVLPVFHQTDCLVTVDNTRGSPHRTTKVFYHAESTAETALRGGVFWGHPSARQDLNSATEIAPLVAALDSGCYVTTWSPITEVLMDLYSDIVVVPGTEFKGFVSLFASPRWTSVVGHQALISFLSLLSQEWRKVARSRRLAIQLDDNMVDSIDQLCGLSIGTNR